MAHTQEVKIWRNDQLARLFGYAHASQQQYWVNNIYSMLSDPINNADENLNRLYHTLDTIYHCDGNKYPDIIKDSINKLYDIPNSTMLFLKYVVHYDITSESDSVTYHNNTKYPSKSNNISIHVVKSDPNSSSQYSTYTYINKIIKDLSTTIVTMDNNSVIIKSMLNNKTTDGMITKPVIKLIKNFKTKQMIVNWQGDNAIKDSINGKTFFMVNTVFNDFIDVCKLMFGALPIDHNIYNKFKANVHEYINYLIDHPVEKVIKDN